MSQHIDRRTVIRSAGVGVVGVVGAAGLTACGGSSDTSNPASKSAAGSAGSAADAIKATDVPVGGGKIFDATKVVVTQPTAGEFKAFSAVCTHKGCIVKTVEDGTINCACHGSKFDLTTGAVKDGPATAPLAAKTATESGGSITIS